jgi:hypothetical protein
MNWEAIGAVGEITGAAAVVVTLGYLARQIRQSMAAAKTDSRQRVLDRYSDAVSNVLAPNVLEAMRNGLDDFSTLSSRDQAAFTLAQSIFANNLLNAIRLRDEGTLDDETFMHISTGFISGCNTPGGRAWWSHAKMVFPPTLVDHVDRELARGATADIAVEEIIPSDDP